MPPFFCLSSKGNQFETDGTVEAISAQTYSRVDSRLDPLTIRDTLSDRSASYADFGQRQPQPKA